MEGRAASVVFKFKIYPFLYTLNTSLSPTDLWSSIYEIRSSLLVTTCPSTAVIMSHPCFIEYWSIMLPSIPALSAGLFFLI